MCSLIAESDGINHTLGVVLAKARTTKEDAESDPMSVTSTIMVRVAMRSIVRRRAADGAPTMRV